MDLAHSRTRVAELLSEKIIRQELPAGRSVGEASLAAELGVSRTPIREALLSLESDGLVRSRHGRGFIVTPLDPVEAAEVFPIIARLERLAVESSPPPSTRLGLELKAINERLLASESAFERVRLDAEWHRLIVSGCGNERLIRLIQSVKQPTLRYEYAYLENSRLRDNSRAEHEQIARLLERSPAQAARALEQHWLSGMNHTLKMLRQGEERCAA